jgi:hypothetical protein
LNKPFVRSYPDANQRAIALQWLKRLAGAAMSYTIGFIPRNQQDMSAAEAPTAHKALAMIAALQETAEEIRFIRSPQEGDMGIEMLLLLAKEEAEEMPQRR